jgi:phosphate transport system substrate-binding protein
VSTVTPFTRPRRLAGRAAVLACVLGGALSLVVPGLAGAAAPGGSLSKNLTSTPSASLTGVGASSAQPFYGRVLYQYNQLNKKVTVTYSPAGSGPGVTAIEQQTASFGQSEVPMSAAELALAKGPVLQVPVDLGGVAISYHVSGVKAGLKLSGPVLAQIYLRQITSWNAPAIAKLNPKVKLPKENIVPVYRADTSGPGYDLDQYLIDTDPAWVTATGSPKASTTWPSAARASGTAGVQLNSGVASYIKETEGSIGFIEYSYTSQSDIVNAALLSKSKTYIAPSITSIAAAAVNAKSVSATNFSIIDGAGKSTYPLANFSWALISQKQASTTAGEALGKLLQWVITSGQAYSKALGYAPLPKSLVTLGHATLLKLETASGQPLFTS